MVEVKCEYVNLMHKTKLTSTDYFVFLDIEVKGHAEHTGYVNNMKVCAGISAVCHGINRLMNSNQYAVVYEKGYFHCWTERRFNLKALDKDSVYALNTIVCQLYEIFKSYPNAFKSFELVDVKEKIDDEENTRSQTSHTKPYRKRKHKLGFYSTLEGAYPEEN